MFLHQCKINILIIVRSSSILPCKIEETVEIPLNYHLKKLGHGRRYKMYMGVMTNTIVTFQTYVEVINILVVSITRYEHT